MSLTRWWHQANDGLVVCDLCPRACRLSEGAWGFCGARQVEGGQLQARTFGRHGGMAVDPMEKKPLYHVLPGTSVLSFGAVGCNLACDFCQNWHLSQRRDLSGLGAATPESIVALALAEGCQSLAFTYNEPIISAEFALEVATAAKEAGLKTIAVTAGYIAGAARMAFFEAMDAANVDLKAFTKDFYRARCKAELAPVLETLAYLASTAHTWLEVTTLLIPGHNDQENQIRELAAWLAVHGGPHVPLHLTAFHPDHHLLDVPPTPLQTLRNARAWARQEGLQHVYLGNVVDQEGGTTACAGCGTPLIVRRGFRIAAYHLVDGSCPTCGRSLEGLWQRT